MDMLAKRALIFANGEWRDGPAARQALTELDTATVIAADGGAQHAVALGLSVRALIGDLDSTPTALVEQLAVAGTAIIRHPPVKDETDLELCLSWALERDYRNLRILAALGGRIDQSLGNVLLLAAPELRDCDAAIVSGDEILRVHHPGRHQFHGALNERLSLLPLTHHVRSIHTNGLRYPLIDETLRMSRGRGISNEFCAPYAEVIFAAGMLLSIQKIGSVERSL